MDTNGTASVKTRYSFYEAADAVDVVNTAPRKTNSVTESRTMETDETGSTNDHDKPIEKYQDRENMSTEDVSESLKMADAKETKSNHEIEVETCENGDITGTQKKPPSRHDEHGTNMHEQAIREALSYIRKRGQQRETMVDKTAPALDAARWKTNSDPVSNLVGGLLPTIPLSPGLDGSAALATATKLDSRLLSPPADVRKAASDMFRHHQDSEDGSNGRDAIKPFGGLELAKPVNSTISTPHWSKSPVNTTDMLNGEGSGVESSIPHFSITPSSPAAGKFHGLQFNGHHSTRTETPEARRQKLESERRTRRELEIEKGVEQVLQLILQRAEANNDSNAGESMEHMLSSLFAEQSISPAASATEKMRKIRVNNNDDDYSEMKDPENENISAAETISLKNSNNEGTGVIPADHSNDSSNVADTSIRPINSKEGMLEVETIDSGTTEDYFDEDDNSNQDEMVLGRLSSKMGGTTGVVLQHDENDVCNDDEGHDDDHSMHEEDDEFAVEDAPASSPSIISSVTSAARRTSKLVAAKLSFSSSNKSMEDIEVLVKELYSHMLIRHPSHKHIKNSNKKDNSLARWMSDHFTSSTTSRPDLMWDEEDPEEPGHIVHTLSRGKLQEIEQVYEDMVDQAGSEYAVAMKDKSNKSHNRTGSDFERDLLDAEKMLDNQKNTSTLKSSGAGSKKKSEKDKVDPASKNASDLLMTNPNFPGAKAAGIGEVGDLEIYHLPIIYKAHQTGFEPTKDLVLQPDTVFAGQYYVQSELGSAAFSTAYRCVDLNSGNKSVDGEVYYDEVCLKVIKNTKDFFDQSLDEIKILELLRQTNECNEHNILEMKAFFYHKEHLIIVTELLRQNLFEFGKYIMEHDEPKYFTRSRLCYIARQCLVALSFVHKLGLVHSDIKPENILLSSYSRARVKVIDFGSSCYLTDRQSSYIQSRSYRAPEVVLGLAYDGKIDVWSLGCVIAEMYTGQVTFQNDSVVSMLARIEAICGAFPRHMIEEGRQNGQFFTPTGLLYEKVETDDDSGMRMDVSSSFQDDDNDTLADSTLFNVLQPKTTTMAERLGFDANLMSSKRKTWEEDEKALFTDFVAKLLTVDPDKRPTADEALEHPWILSGFNLTEDDLKYPPEE